MSPLKFRKKPVEVEAVLVPPTPGDTAGRRALAEWCGGWATEDLDWDFDAGCWKLPNGRHADGQYRDNGIVVPTLEGPMYAERGDWIIRGIAGEFYPCKPSIFDATYERVTPDPHSKESR